LDRYRRRFWNKGVVPVLSEENSGQSLREATDASEAVHQTGTDSHTESEYASSDESSYEALQNIPSPNSKFFQDTLPQKDPDDISRMEGVRNFETLDPKLDPALFELSKKTEEPANPWPQQSKLNRGSHSPAAVLEARSGIQSNKSNNMSKVRSLSCSSSPQKAGLKAESPQILDLEASGRISRTSNIDAGADKCANEDIKNHSGDNNPQTVQTCDVEMVVKGVNTSPAPSSPKINSDTSNQRVTQFPSSIPNSTAETDAQLSSALQSPRPSVVQNSGVRIAEQFSHNSVDAAYSFSDNEDVVEIKPVKRQASLHFQSPKARTYKASVKSQKLGTPMKDSTIQKTTAERQPWRRSLPKSNQSPISISSSSSVDDLPELEEENFYLERTTPAPPISESNRKLSGILGRDDFEELRKTPIAPRIQPLQEKTKTLLPEEVGKGPLNDIRQSPARNITPKRRTLTSTTKASILRRSMGSSPSGPLIETPGGSLKKCGEKGFRCGKEFCFKCMAD
jgi:hypothetical protein